LLLAASWGRALDCEAITQEIQRGIGFLQTQQKAFPERQSSMQAVFDHSWRLLSEHERAVLRRLSIFQGTFDRGAAESVAGADLPILATLIDQSFVDRVSKDRYQIHELLRQYLRDRLVEADEEARVRAQHLTHYTRVAEQAEPELRGKDQRAWVRQLHWDIDNFRLALDWSLEGAEAINLENGLRLLTSLERFWLLQIYIRDGYAYLTRILERGQAAWNDDSFVRTYAHGLNLAAKLSFLLDDLAATRRFADEALRMGEELEDPRIIGDACFHRGVETLHRTEFAAARKLLERALENYLQCDYLPGITEATCVLGRVDLFSNEFSAAFPTMLTALELARKQGDIRIIYATLRSLGQLGLLDPEFGLARARGYYSEGLQYAREMEDKRYVGVILDEMGELARLEGDLEEAAARMEEADSIASELRQNRDRSSLAFVYFRLGKHQQSLQMFLSTLVYAQLDEDQEWVLPLCLLGLAGLMVTMGEAQTGVRVLGALETHKEELLSWPIDKMEYERIVASAKAKLREKQFDECYQEGQTLSLADAARLVQNQGINRKGRYEERLPQLTKREIEILRLVAQGLSDAQVAERLVLGPRTVNAHLTSIYRKIDVNSRAAATRFAIEHGLA
jgi:DNA-binding CsgD family transcriptional regulator